MTVRQDSNAGSLQGIQVLHLKKELRISSYLTADAAAQ